MGAKLRFTQQTIVFVIFVALFAGFALFLPGFASTSNLLTLLQNVAVLGILGLAMAVVVIGRGIDISLVATLAVPPGPRPADGAGRPFAAGLARHRDRADDRLRADQRLADRLCRSPSLFATLGDRTVSGRLRARHCCSGSMSCNGARHSLASNFWVRARFSACRCRSSCSRSPASSSRCSCRRRGSAPIIYAIGDNPNGARMTGIPTRPIMVLSIRAGGADRLNLRAWCSPRRSTACRRAFSIRH